MPSASRRFGTRSRRLSDIGQRGTWCSSSGPMLKTTLERWTRIQFRTNIRKTRGDHVLKIEEKNQTPGRAGAVLHAAAGYDLLVWLLTLGRERTFRERMLRLGHLEAGESVLDVGCGTGTLAIAAKRQVGTTGAVYGLDASPEMIARAEKKARKAGVEVAFKKAFAQSLPFPDAQFDVVLTTVMLHHLSRKARQQLAVEMRRVLKPGGRVLAIDFGGTARKRKRLLDHF